MTGLAAAVLVGVVGLSVGLFFVNAEKERTELARQGEETQRIEAQTQAELARNNEKEAKDRETETKAVLDFVEKRVFAAARPKTQEGGMGYDVQLADAVKASLSFVEKNFQDQPLIEARLRLMLGTSFRYMGAPKIAVEQDERARTIYTKHRGPDHRDTLGSMNNVAESYAELGRHDDALKLREETLALRKAKLGPDHPDTLSSTHNLANSYYAFGRYADALKLHEETLALMKAKHGPDHPDTLLSMGNLAEILLQLGRGAEAVTIIDECLKRAAGKVVDPRLIPFVMDLRLRHFEKAKDAAGCRATAEILEKLKHTDAGSLYNAACYRAVTAAVLRANDILPDDATFRAATSPQRPGRECRPI